MNTLTLTCLDTFAATLNGQAITHFPTDKVQALLAYLALEPRAQRRETLAGLFWPEIGEEYALKNLRSTLHRLRQTLDSVAPGLADTLLLANRQTVELAAAQVTVDALTVERLVLACEQHAHEALARCDHCLTNLIQAVTLYQGELLAGFGLADAPAFEEWLVLRREHLQHHLLRALGNLADAYAARGELETATTYASRQLTFDPYREDVHRQVMRLLAQRGLTHQALAHYTACCRILRDELGVEPDAETTALVEQIRTGKIDKMTNDKVTERVPSGREVTLSPPHLVTLPPTPRHNLPAALPVLIGREQEIVELMALMNQTRLLTVTGAAGSGKTRLALEIANRVRDQMPDGVWLVEMAAISDPAHVAQTVNATLGVRETSLPPQAALIGYLQTKALLLVLDSSEPVQAACATLVERLLATCAQVRIVATSREPLHVSGEQLWATTPLAAPETPTTLPPEQLMHYAAVRLFVERARQAKAGFALTPQNAPAVSQICRRLDGLPLALELAAARIRALSAQEIAARLDDRFQLLSEGSRPRAHHQQTLRSTLDWGYDLLSAPEQRLFRQLAVFVGGWTLAAAEVVCADILSPASPADAVIDIFELHSQLVDKSLVFLEEQENGTRYSMLETINQYAYSRLAATSEVEGVRKRHLAFFLTMAKAAAPKLRSAEQAMWYMQLAAEHGNLRAALDWAETSGQVSVGLELAGSLYYFWHVYGHRREGLARLQNILAHPEAAAPTLSRAKALLGMGHMYCDSGVYDLAQPLLTEALTLAQGLGDQSSVVWALSFLGAIAGYHGDTARAHALLEQSIALARTLDDRYTLCMALNLLGQLALRQGDYDQARRFYVEGVALLRGLGIQGDLAYFLRQLGHAAVEGGDLGQAAACYRESLILCLAVKGNVGMLANVAAYARLAALSGDLATAAQLCGAVESLQHTLSLTLWPSDQAGHERTVAAVHTERDEQRVASLWADGQAMTLEQAVQFALALQDKVTSDKVTSDKVTSDKVTGDKVTSTSSVTLSPPHLVTLSVVHDWGEMPAVDFFAGRTAEMAQLKAWLIPMTEAGGGARLVTILGIGGMGKTTLAAAAVKAVAPRFETVIWRSLLNAPPLAEILRNWLQILSRQTLISFPESLDEQMRLLLDYLRQQRCLLVLDNVESILQAGDNQGRAGEMRPDYEGYAQLFQRLAGSEHQSCLLLTSREQPYALARHGRQTQESSGPVRLLPLMGLPLPAGHAILQSNGLHATSQEAALLVRNYSGNPLALQIVATTIADFFGGDIAVFQQEEGFAFDGIRAVLDQQFARLSELERELLIWLAIERAAITVHTLRTNLVHAPSTAELLGALQALQARSVLEKTGNGLTLQNVIIEYTTEYLVESICSELSDKVTRWQGDKVNEDTPITLSPHHPVTLSFLNRFALLKAQAKEYVRQSQARLFLKPVTERLLAKLGRAGLVARLQQLLDAMRAEPRQPGYAAGNLLNLLRQLGVDLAGYDFSNLAVWQADLRGMMAAAINFTDADLQRSAFTLTFDTQAVYFLPSGNLMVGGVIDGDLCLWQAVDGQLAAAVRTPSKGGYPMIFSPDGRFVAAHGLDHLIRVWSTEDGALVQTLYGHQSAVYALAISPDGNLLASGTNEAVVRLWDLRTADLLQTLDGHEHGVEALAFSPDGRTLASGDNAHCIRLWDLENKAEKGRLIATLDGHRREIGALAFAADGALLASGSHDGLIRVWDLNTRACVQTLQGHTSIIRALCFPPQPEPHLLLASASADATVRLWSPVGQLQSTLLGHTYEVEALAFSQDGHTLASSGADRKVYLWDTRTGDALNALQAYRHRAPVARFSPDRQVIASGSTDGFIRLWSLAPAVDALPAQPSPLIRYLRGHADLVSTVAFGPVGMAGAHLLASGGFDRAVRLWEVATGQEVHQLLGHTGAVTSVAFSPDGALLASASSDYTIRLWPLAENLQRKVAQHQRLVGHQAELTAIVFSPTGVSGAHTLASSSLDNTARLWNVESAAPLHVLAGHTGTVSSVAISPDGRTVATSSFDHTVRLWDAATGECLHIWREGQIGDHAVAFSPDGKLLAYGGGDFAIYLRDWRTWALVARLPGHTNSVLSLEFSQSAPLLLSSSWDSTIRLWDLETNTCRQTFIEPGPYAGMNISGVTGISEAQKAALRALGAVEE